MKKMSIQILQGTLELLILRTLATMGLYGVANRLQQVSKDALNLGQGADYPTGGSWGKMEGGRDAKYYSITRTGLQAFDQDTGRCRKMSGVVEKPLAEER